MQINQENVVKTTMRERKLRSGVNLQGVLKLEGIEQGLDVDGSERLVSHTYILQEEPPLTVILVKYNVSFLRLGLRCERKYVLSTRRYNSIHS